MMYIFLYTMTLLVTFQLSAQEKRWQLDSIQSVQQLASDKEKVFGHYQQLYDPQKKVITLLYKYKIKMSLLIEQNISTNTTIKTAFYK